MPLRTHTCGEPNLSLAGREVTLAGWVQASRNLGSLLFLQLRDRYGLCQVTFRKEEQPDLFEQAAALRSEFVVRVKGVVTARGPKDVGSTEGMERTRTTSPFYPAWLARAPADLREGSSRPAARTARVSGCTSPEGTWWSTSLRGPSPLSTRMVWPALGPP